MSAGETPSRVTRIFISHLHRDKAIASVIHRTLAEWKTPWKGANEIYVSSASDAGTPPGDNILQDIKKHLAQASLVILVFTFGEYDWSWPWYEYGVATDLSDQARRRLIIFQCCEDVPRFMGAYKRQHVTKEAIQEFTRDYFTLNGFFPGMGPFQEDLPKEAIVALANTFYDRLKEKIPQRDDVTTAAVLPKQALFESERRKPEGILTDPGRVMIRSAQPMERDYDFAVRILENLRAGIGYRYYFSNEADLGPVGLLVQALAVAGIEDLREVGDRIDGMEAHADVIQENLERVRRQVAIFFLTDPSPEEFTAYNWNDVDAAQYYVRYRLDDRDGMILLYEGFRAYRAVKRLDRLSDDPDLAPKDTYLFHSTDEVSLYDEPRSPFLSKLEETIVNNFHPSLTEAVKRTCFRRA